jgi:hypothetical protein
MVSYALAMEMVRISFPLYGMHWKWYGMVPHALAFAMKMKIVWYALAMVFYGKVCIGNGNGNGIHWQWDWYELV